MFLQMRKRSTNTCMSIPIRNMRPSENLYGQRAPGGVHLQLAPMHCMTPQSFVEFAAA